MLKSERRETQHRKARIKKRRGGTLAAQKLRQARARGFEGTIRRLARRS